MECVHTTRTAGLAAMTPQCAVLMTDRSQARGLALIPIALLLHNAEEGLTVRPEMRDHLSRLLGHMVQLPSVEQYHVAAAAWVGGYAPGLATAVPVELPTSIAIYRTQGSSNRMTSRQRARVLGAVDPRPRTVGRVRPCPRSGVVGAYADTRKVRARCRVAGRLP